MVRNSLISVTVIDRSLAGLLLLGAGGHTFGSIESYGSQPKALLWAVCASVLAALLSALNLLRTFRRGDQALAWLTAGGTASWLTASVIFGFLIRNPFDPRVVGFELITLGLIYFGLKEALSPASRGEEREFRLSA